MRSGGVAARALAPRSRPRLYEWFPRDVGASTSRATRSSPRPGRAWRDAMCCVRGRTSYLTSICDRIWVLLEMNMGTLFTHTSLVF